MGRMYFPEQSAGRGRAAAALLALLVGLALLSASPATAATPKLFTSFPETESSVQLSEIAAVATNPVTGDVYVAEGGNRRESARISEFTAWGEFVRAWGWGVVLAGPDNGPHNEVQKVSLSAGTSAGSFKLEFLKATSLTGDGNSFRQTTSSIGFAATANQLREALEGLGSIGPGDVAVSGGTGGPWTVEFTASYTDMDIAPLEVTGSTLVGGTASVQTLQGGGSFEICEPSAGDICGRGQRSGASPGEISKPHGLAFSPAGDVYVYEGEGEGELVRSLRVQKFSASGEFLTIFGGGVDKTSGANICSKADIEAGDECGVGVPGSGEAQFLNVLGNGTGGNIAVGSDGTVYVGDNERIQRFNSAGAYLGSLPLPSTGNTQALAYDSAADALYFAFRQNFSEEEPEEPNVYKLDPTTGKVLRELPIDFPQSLASDPTGHLYVIGEARNPKRTEEVVEFDSAGNPVIGIGEGFDRFVLSESAPYNRTGLAVNSACGTVGIYVANADEDKIAAYGPTPNPALCPPPVRPPTISDQYAVSVGSEAAVVRATINPHFWEDTRYYVQYGTSDCKLGGCAEQPVAPGLTLAGAGVNANLTSAGITLSGLAPDTTYHYRFVAQSSGGGPVLGIGEGEDGAAFTTRSLPDAPSVDCPNQSLRTGVSANLPDCRAYEMVSPVDKDGGNAIARPAGGGPAMLDQSAEDGQGLTFSSYRSFGGAEGATYSTQYLSTRQAGVGWATEPISPPNGVSFVSLGNTIGNEFAAFSADLCHGWFNRNTNPPLKSSAPPGYANLYGRDNCGEDGPEYTALINAAVPGSSGKSFWPELQGASADESHVVFRANAKLTEDASSTAGIAQLYEQFKGKLRLVSILPSEEASELGSSAGTKFGLGKNRTDTVARAVSADGSKIYWTEESNGAGAGTGQIFVRVGGHETLPVSGTVTASPARFWTAAESGSVAFFTVGETLYRYSLADEVATPVAGQVSGVVGASADASRLYLLSREALSSGSTAGKPNLYLDEEGSFTFVATLATLDASTNIRSLGSKEPNEHVARVSEDGLHLAFMATSRSLSEATAGYDNTDVDSGEPDAQVYVYDATGGNLHCVSCDPTGARPRGRQIVNGKAGESNLWAASQIPGWPSQLYASRVLSPSGDRLFFESYSSLLAADTNAAEDVYQWEMAGSGDCTDTSSAFRPSAGGCVSLISSGTSPQDSEFVDAGIDGTDVFFTTEASLQRRDPGQIDIYDARVEGGFPEVSPGVDCVGEACQQVPAPPSDLTPGSAGYIGSGNPANSPKHSCPKGKHRVKKNGTSRCVKRAKHSKKQHRQRRQAGASGRAGR
jgi:hypothetical protein